MTTTTEPIRPQLTQLRWPVRTERLALRPATWDDLLATWEFRRREDVAQWLTRAPVTLSEYRPLFLDCESLAKSMVIELDGGVIGDLMLSVEYAWAQTEVVTKAAAPGLSSAGSCTPTTPAAATPPKRCAPCCGWRSRTWACAGSPRTASPTTSHRGA